MPSIHPLAYGTIAASLYATFLYLWDQTLTGWAHSGSITLDNSIGNPAPSINVPGSTHTRREITQVASFAGKTIEVDMYGMGGTPLCNFFFGCNSSGSGQVFRLECRSSGGSGSGVAPTSSFSPVVPSAVIPGNYSANAWHTVRIVINPAGTACDVYVDGVQQLTNVGVTLSGRWINCHGDGGTGGKFDNIKVY